MVEPHDFACGAHFRSEQDVHTGETGEGEDGFFHSNVIKALCLQAKRGQTFPCHDAGRDFGHRRADHLGHKGYGA